MGVSVVRGDCLGRTDPGSAQPDDSVADDCHRPARHLAFRWRTGRRAGASVTDDQIRSVQPGGAVAARAFPVTAVPGGSGNGSVTATTEDRPASGARTDRQAGGDEAVSRHSAVSGILRRHWLAAALLAAGLVLRV